MEKQTTASVYLGGPFYTPAQKQRVQKAQEYLRQNPTVGRVHFPFDHQYTNPADPSDASSLKWQLATYQNDLQGMINTDCAIFLYDMDQIDDGSAFEIGFLRALHKPAVMIPFSEKKDAPRAMNLMLARGVTALISFADLKSYDFTTCPSAPVDDYQIF